jgi:hypothetical protein
MNYVRTFVFYGTTWFGLTVMASPKVFARGVDHSLELVDEHLAPEHVRARRDSASRWLATRLAI